MVNVTCEVQLCSLLRNPQLVLFPAGNFSDYGLPIAKQDHFMAFHHYHVEVAVVVQRTNLCETPKRGKKIYHSIYTSQDVK